MFQLTEEEIQGAIFHGGEEYIANVQLKKVVELLDGKVAFTPVGLYVWKQLKEESEL